MVILYTLLVVLVCVLVALSVRPGWFLNDARRRKLPARRRVTMFDVRHMLMEGKKELAIQLYCEIFKTTPYKARKDVEDLERSLKV